MARNYKAEYAARQSRAKSAGFTSYGEQRKLRSLASNVIPGRSRAAVAARDLYAADLSKGADRARRGAAEKFTDLLVEPKYGTLDIAHLQGQLSAVDFAELQALMADAFTQSSGGKIKGTISAATLQMLNEWLIEHDIDVSDWWAELYGR